MAISLSRMAARESVRLATLAQAMRRTRATATSKINRRARTSLTSPVCKETAETSAFQDLGMGQGNRAGSCDCIMRISVAACCMVAPGRKRPIRGMKSPAQICLRDAGIHIERNPYIGLRGREVEVARHYANDLALNAFEADRVADDRGIGSETLCQSDWLRITKLF